MLFSINKKKEIDDNSRNRHITTKAVTFENPKKKKKTILTKTQFLEDG